MSIVHKKPVNVSIHKIPGGGVNIQLRKGKKHVSVVRHPDGWWDVVDKEHNNPYTGYNESKAGEAAKGLLNDDSAG